MNVFSVLNYYTEENQRPRKVMHDDGKQLYFKLLKRDLKKDDYKG
ncbi:MAG TPA: hypothetical protein VJ767_03260 [Nitrososphaeraceae archaeon]|nr:hypothetical protein [Nitrososphaeraceae archaeon]